MMVLALLLFLNSESFASWTCWQKDNIKPTAATMKAACGNASDKPQLVCRQNVYCADIKPEMRAGLDRRWATYAKEREGLEATIADGATESTDYWEAILLAQDNPYIQMALQAQDANWKANMREEMELLEKNKVEAEVSCPGSVSKSNKNVVECPPPDRCHSATIVQMTAAQTVLGGFTSAKKELPEDGKAGR